MNEPVCHHCHCDDCEGDCYPGLRERVLELEVELAGANVLLKHYKAVVDGKHPYQCKHERMLRAILGGGRPKRLCAAMCEPKWKEKDGQKHCFMCHLLTKAAESLKVNVGTD